LEFSLSHLDVKKIGRRKHATSKKREVLAIRASTLVSKGKILTLSPPVA